MKGPKAGDTVWIDHNLLYAYALGYYDGRALGVENNTFDAEDQRRHLYSEGYERGVSDYCELDEAQ